MTIALTGASGYVGAIIAAGLPPTQRLVRLGRHPAAGDVPWQLDGPNAGLADALASTDVRCLIHAAWDMKASGAADVDRLCIRGSLALLEAAENARVSRVVFISTISAFDGAQSVYGRAKRTVERAVLERGGIVLRLGLVHGTEGGVDGGMIGSIRRSVRTSKILPMIGDGSGPQYLLDAARLQRAVNQAASGALDRAKRPITLADETPVTFKNLIRRVATTEGKRPILIPIPWHCLYLAIRSIEMLGLQPAVRSDSVISFVHADRAPDFTETKQFRL